MGGSETRESVCEWTGREREGEREREMKEEEENVWVQEKMHTAAMQI